MVTRLYPVMVMAQGYEIRRMVCASKPARDNVVHFKRLIISLSQKSPDALFMHCAAWLVLTDPITLDNVVSHHAP